MTGKLHWMAMVCLIGAGLIVLTVSFLGEPGAKALAESAPAPLPVVTEPLSDASAYRRMSERPLFIAGRRPQPVVKTEVLAAAIPVTKPAVTLLGVMLDKARRAVLVKPVGGKEAVVVPEGGVIDGWNVRQVRAEGAVLTAGSNDWQLSFPRSGSAEAKRR